MSKSNIIAAFWWNELTTGSTQSCWVGRESKWRNEKNEQFTFVASFHLSYAILTNVYQKAVSKTAMSELARSIYTDTGRQHSEHPMTTSYLGI